MEMRIMAIKGKERGVRELEISDCPIAMSQTRVGLVTICRNIGAYPTQSVAKRRLKAIVRSRLQSKRSGELRRRIGGGLHRSCSRMQHRAQSQRFA